MHKIKTEMQLRKNHLLLHILTKKPHLWRNSSRTQLQR